MAYRDLRDFMAQLEARGELRRIAVPVDPKLEMTALADRVLQAGGPALLFEQPKGDFRAPDGSTIPVLANLFGTPQRVARAMGVEGDDWRTALRDIGKLLAFLKEPEPPKSLLDAWQTLLGFLLYFLIPWTAINLVDYYLVRKGSYELAGFGARDGVYGRWNKAGMIAFAIGCLAQLPFVVSVFYTGPLARFVDGGDISWLIGTLVAGAAYYLLAPRWTNGPIESTEQDSTPDAAVH